MQSSKRVISSPRPASHPAGRPGLTLIELLVVIVIIAVLAVLGFTGMARVRVAAAKTTTSSEMRQIHVGMALWMADNSATEPFYAANGTATFGHESTPGSNPKLAPGNPAIVMFDHENPENSYLQDPGIFFSPLTTYEVPTLAKYRPDQVKNNVLWGTYAWYYPSVAAENLSGRQAAAIANWTAGPFGPGVAGKLLMAPDYARAEPKYDKYYLALMIDGSVTDIGKGDNAWNRWRIRGSSN